jgi:hypothetical protein
MIELPDTNDISRIADWIELYVVSEEEAISKSKLTTAKGGGFIFSP